jgi:hypothetical protein
MANNVIQRMALSSSALRGKYIGATADHDVEPVEKGKNIDKIRAFQADLL